MGSKAPHRPTADEAIQMLKNGNKRFVTEELKHPNHCEESRHNVVTGQKPFCTVLTCSDSRVPPVDIFDQGLGDIFVVRVAGNIIGDHTLGSIEYAVKHLHTPVILVLGHSNCGAVTAVASGTAFEGHIATLAPAIQTAIKKAKDVEGNPIDNASIELAKQISRRIAASEPIIADLVREGKVKVLPAFYNLQSGKVDFLEA